MEYLTQSEIHARPRWHPRHITRYLGEPDRRLLNTRGQPALYQLARVLEVERRWDELERLAASPDYISRRELRAAKWHPRDLSRMGPDLTLDHLPGHPVYYARERLPGYRYADLEEHLPGWETADIPSISDGPPTDPEDLRMLSQVRGMLDSIDPWDADIVELTLRGCRQADLAVIFGVSQPTISYRYHRAIETLQWQLSLPPIDPDQARRDMAGVFDDLGDVEIVLGFFDVSNQSIVGDRLGISQGRVRHRLLRAVRRMDGVPGLEVYVDRIRRQMARHARHQVRAARAVNYRSGCVID